MSAAGAAAAAGMTRAGLMRSLDAMLRTWHPTVALAPLLARVGIAEVELADPDALISVARGTVLLDELARATGDAHFAVSYAAQMPWNDLGVLGYVLMHSPTLGSAYGNLSRYFAIQQTAGGTRLEIGGRRARLIRLPAPATGASPHAAELMQALYVRLARDGTGDAGWAPRAVSFRHARPRSTAALDRFFRAPLRFGQRSDAIELAPADLRRPFRTADPGLLPILVAHAEASLARTPGRGEVGGDVRRLVVAALAAGDLTIEAVAAHLGVSPRSLQRRLRDAGLSFQLLVSEARLDLARRYLADPQLTLTEAAFLLGYADLSAFSRAFRRWTGKSPQHVRREARP